MSKTAIINPIRRCLFENGMSQINLADQIGRSDGWVSNLCRYRLIPATADERELIAGTLKTTVGILWPALVAKKRRRKV